MRTAKGIRYRLEWLSLKSATKFLPLLSRKACYQLALLLGSLAAILGPRGRRVALSNLRVASRAGFVQIVGSDLIGTLRGFVLCQCLALPLFDRSFFATLE
jgi:hypothetical protein